MSASAHPARTEDLVQIRLTDTIVVANQDFMEVIVRQVIQNSCFHLQTAFTKSQF